MTFAWPWLLLALLLLPLAVWGYLRGLRRPVRAAALHPDLRLLARAAGGRPGWRRHLGALLYLLALVLALLALARPSLPLPLPDNRTTIMLAIDVSLSMSANDISPSRIVAAQQAARVFVRSLPQEAKVGLVSFAGYAVLNTPPTTHHDDLLSAIDGLNLGAGTAIGSGLLEALHALPGRAEGTPRGTPRPPAAIVLLTDGRNNRGVDPLLAAEQVRAGDVQVFTVGLGTNASNAEDGQNGWFGLGFDPEILRAIAHVTRGQYYEANSAGQLGSIYRKLGRSLGWVSKPREVTGLLAALAGLLLLGSLAHSELSVRRLL